MGALKLCIRLGILLALGCQATVAHSADVKLPGSPQPIAASYFGMHIHHIGHPSLNTTWPDVPFGTWRLWDANVNWPYLEASKGVWDFSKLDKYVDLATLHNVEILLPLGLTPQWASARPNEKSSYMLGNAAEPQNIDDWRNYVRTVATRYKGRIHHYELWNEVSFPSFYSGTPKKLVDLAREAYLILKSVDPTITFVSPSVAGETAAAINWLDQYLTAGGDQYADVIGYHFYVPTKSPEAMVDLVRRVRALTVKHGLVSKPIWNTESGWRIANSDSTPETGAPKCWLRLSPSEAAGYVSRALILGYAAGVQRYYWYAWDNSFMGLINVRSKTDKPAALAYAQTYTWLVGNKIQGCTQTGQIWVCDLIEANNAQSHLAWTTGPDTTWAAPTTWKAVNYQGLDGINHSLNSGTPLTLTQTPIRITN